ncbi:MAG: sugar ABC transporter ATP-binding protein [Verrucomicrobiota bacterium]
MIEFINIEKSFFGVRVLKRVSFAVKPGQTIGLVGENGAGKSTLMNILGGNLRPDAGELRMNGQPYAPQSPRDAERARVAFIHQELNLFANLTIAENIFIGGFPRRVRWLPFIDRRKMYERTRELLREMNLSYAPDTPLERLSAGERQLVEIAKALAFEARLIIFDEPTTSLTVRETERLFAIMGQLRERGISMVYISHSLGHVLKLCDEVVVLRDGAVVGNEPASQFTLERMVSLMVGRAITQIFPKRDTQPASEVALDVRGLAQPGVARAITFQLHCGEILGVSGLMGSGRSELARILFGLDPCAAGDVRLNGELLNGLPPRDRIARGLAFLTEDRRAEGLCMEAAIADNVALVALPRFVRTWARFVSTADSRAAVATIRQAVKLTPSARDEQAVKTLSGGNQQKVVLAKWLLNEPKVFILDEPTRGIDVGAKHEIYRLINELAACGAAVLMISSEVEELIGMCDRILVMGSGEIRDTVEPHQFDRERILRAAIHDGALS